MEIKKKIIKLNGDTLKPKFNKKGKYSIPIIIREPLGGTQYSFQVTKDILDLKKDKIYKADYKLIKTCNKLVWDYLNNE